MRIYFSIIVLFLTFQGFAQEISGRAYYTSIFKGEKPELTEKQMNNPHAKDLAEQLGQTITDEFVLEFTSEESIFRMLPKLQKPNPQAGRITIRRTIMGEDEILYKNLKEKKLLNEKELYSKKFLIQDNLENKDWELSKESKTIGEYVCFKATYRAPRLRSDNDEGDAPRLRSETNENDSPRLRSEADEIIAWYTPQIPVQNGPTKYDGLPGLILEVQQGNQKFVCTKIVLNPDESIVIEKPNKGKKVSQEEFDIILKEKSQDMRENFKSRKRRN